MQHQISDPPVWWQIVAPIGPKSLEMIAFGHSFGSPNYGLDWLHVRQIGGRFVFFKMQSLMRHKIVILLFWAVFVWK